MTIKKIPVMKADELTSGGRIYSVQSFKEALKKFKWDMTLPLTTVDRHKDKKEVAYLRKSDVVFDENEKILYVALNEDVRNKIFGLTIVPYVYINKVVRKDKNSVIIWDFTLNGFQATSDLCSFPTLNANVSA